MHLIRCEWCKKQLNREYPPPDWWVLGNAQIDCELHFCKVGCAINMLTQKEVSLNMRLRDAKKEAEGEEMCGTDVP